MWRVVIGWREKKSRLMQQKHVRDGAPKIRNREKTTAINCIILDAFMAAS